MFGNDQFANLYARPWGLRRMAHYPNTVTLGYSRVELDPATQTGVYLDSDGQPIEAGRHGTGTDTRSPTGTSTDGSNKGDNDSDSNPDGDQD
ncbi:MAG: putative ATP-grasp-modified RiPP [Actinoallomurus sp.]